MKMNSKLHIISHLGTTRVRKVSTRLRQRVRQSLEHQRKKLAESYVEGFTVHGLTKIFMGHILEKIFWFIVMVLCLGYVGYISHQFYTEYKQFDIYMNFKWKYVQKFYFPSISICPYDGHDGYSMYDSTKYKDAYGVYCVDGMQHFNKSCSKMSKIWGLLYCQPQLRLASSI